MLRDDAPVGPEERGDLERALATMRRAAVALDGASIEALREHDVSVVSWVDRLGVGPATRGYLYAWTSAVAGAPPEAHPMLAVLQVLARQEEVSPAAEARTVALANGATALAEAIAAALRFFVPEAELLAATGHDWTRDPWARGGWMSEPPGWATDGTLDLLARPHGRVLMAGAGVAFQTPGWISGAIHSGRAAAVTADKELVRR